jgi:hypothetical protein
VWNARQTYAAHLKHQTHSEFGQLDLILLGMSGLLHELRESEKYLCTCHWPGARTLGK